MNMITVSSQNFYSDAREELGKHFAELKRDIEARMSRLLVFEGEETVDFNYCVLRAQLETILFVEYYLLGAKEKNWLCTTQTERPVKRPDQFVKIVEDAKQMILRKQPTFNTRYNSMYFMALHFLNKIEVKDDGT